MPASSLGMWAVGDALLVPGRGRLPQCSQWRVVGGRCGLAPIPLFPIRWQPGLEGGQAGPVPLCERCARVKSLAGLLAA